MEGRWWFLLAFNIGAVASMVVTPVGPFCAFRSAAVLALDSKMSRLERTTPDFASDMARIQKEMEIGRMPNPEQLLSAASGLEEAVEDWEELMTRLRISPDFQTKEYAKLTQAHLERYGQTIEGIGEMMRWQGGVMRAMAKNIPPPLPPPGVIDLMKVTTNTNINGKPPSLTNMVNARYISSKPFQSEEKVFLENPNVKSEYESLCRDHAGLIEMGGSYAQFDPAGKLVFLDQMEALEERWDIFFARFSLMGMIDPTFVKECDAFLSSMNLDEQSFRSLLKRAHECMREDAQRERNQAYLL
mmetsp:Transcript_15220/g.21706  ORF Transcript_15220/g.21706 Transcript_15220/m.21706 type:complete len:301 (+) Transcript_15220:101-1003(+)|eukprot:CAMPEP_0172426816 /NCGR_PEP_ID=MMETSP1064-20121228/39277_1 /TAXON_ID=202472 /ORGANISM="Aulacoseira subarctica , Strain CCAP 1002/5" /LENGTH=300 /DNA_ID=CAMNT_0013170643 /DNA_START=90 /DNA_END=992 /DNA_ORIENTATION=-